jgi:PIN domain nuclease of toxin-antitoxin system
MKFLLDTHTLLRFLREPEILPPGVLETIEQSGKEAGVSLASLWEIAIKVLLNKLHLPKIFSELFPQSIHESGLSLLPVEPRHLEMVSRMAFHHRDPFDRLIIAHAQVDGLTILTCDKAFTAYEVAILWQ